jgi:hypothetical protein
MKAWKAKVTGASSKRLVPAALTVALALAGCTPGEGEAAADAVPAAPAARSDAEVLRPPVETIASPAGPLSLAPELTRVDGQPALTWIERSREADGPARVRFARLGTAGSDVVTVAPASGSPAELFANWADRPGVVQGGEALGGPLYAWWLAKSGDGTYAYSVEVARSTDAGATWQPLGTLHSDATPAEHGFVTLVPEGPGVRAFWLDGRATALGEPMTLRTVLVTDRIERGSAELLDASVCDCCNTAAAVTADGPVVVYRDRTGEEVRDHRVVRRTPDGRWSEPAPLHRDGWKIPACPVNGPAIAVSRDALWVAWFTAAEGRPQVLAARSGDGGRSFGDPLLVDGDAPLGRLDLEPDGAGGAIVSWLGTGEGASPGEREATIRLRRLTPDGRLGPVAEVARADGSRATGVPRLLADGERLLVAWIEPAEGSRAGTLHLASLAAGAVPLR